MNFESSPLDLVLVLFTHTEDGCFRKAKYLKLQTKKSAAQNASRKAKSASTCVAHASKVTSDYESAEEDF